MIRGFEEQTHDLTPEEIKSMGIIKIWLCSTTSKNPITNKTIRKRLKGFKIEIADSRIRKIINHLRITGKISLLLASSKGYYVSSDPSEIKEYIISLEERIGAISGVREAITSQFENL